MIALSDGNLSLGTLVVFTVPVLAYAWLLKHVSRSYIQNSMLAVDADHRRVMAMTFLGLAKNENVAFEAADRALILNALFRPAPPNTTDDGPPTGLADFLRGKT